MNTERLKQLRIERQLTQDVLARIARVPRSAIVELEGGKRKSIGARHLKRICLALAVSADWLLGDE